MGIIGIGTTGTTGSAPSKDGSWSVLSSSASGASSTLASKNSAKSIMPSSFSVSIYKIGILISERLAHGFAVGSQRLAMASENSASNTKSCD